MTIMVLTEKRATTDDVTSFA